MFSLTEELVSVATKGGPLQKHAGQICAKARWLIQRGKAVISKSVRRERIDSTMKKNTEGIDSKAQESNHSNRRNFIAKSIFAGAGLAAGSLALAASQNQASAQTEQRKKELAGNRKVATDSLPGRRRLGT